MRRKDKSTLLKIIEKEGHWATEDLPLQQRAYVWSAINIVELLDSIFREYPLGLIIYKQATGLEYVKKDDGKTEIARKDEPIIYDGQQRITTIRNIFCSEGFPPPKEDSHRSENCKTYLDVTLFCKLEKERRESRSDKENKTEYPKFKNRTGKMGTYPIEVFPEGVISNEKLKKGKLEEAKDQEDLKRFLSKTRTNWKDAERHKWISLYDLYHKEYVDLEEDERVVKKKLMKCLSGELLQEMRISDNIEGIDLEGLFVRLNRSGKAVTDAEQYFAAVKTYWNQAEGVVKEISGESTVFDMFDVLGIMVNIAHNEERREAAKYLALRLRNFRDPNIVKKLKHMNIKELINAIKMVEEECGKILYYGLNCINKKLLVILVVIFFNNRTHWNWKKVCSFLLKISESGVLSYGDTHLRSVFKGSWGKSDISYEDEDLEADMVEKFKKRCLIDLISFKGTPLLWLSIFQKISLQTDREEFDIDHIMPQAWVKSLKKDKVGELRGASGSTNIGNQWVVKSSRNRQWGDNYPPKIKLKEEDVVIGDINNNLFIEEYKKTYPDGTPAMMNVDKTPNGEKVKKQFREKFLGQENTVLRDKLVKVIKIRGQYIVKKVRENLGIKI